MAYNPLSRHPQSQPDIQNSVQMAYNPDASFEDSYLSSMASYPCPSTSLQPLGMAQAPQQAHLPHNNHETTVPRQLNAAGATDAAAADGWQLSPPMGTAQLAPPGFAVASQQWPPASAPTKLTNGPPHGHHGPQQAAIRPVTLQQPQQAVAVPAQVGGLQLPPHLRLPPHLQPRQHTQQQLTPVQHQAVRPPQQQAPLLSGLTDILSAARGGASNISPLLQQGNSSQAVRPTPPGCNFGASVATAPAAVVPAAARAAPPGFKSGSLIVMPAVAAATVETEPAATEGTPAAETAAGDAQGGVPLPGSGASATAAASLDTSVAGTLQECSAGRPSQAARKQSATTATAGPPPAADTAAASSAAAKPPAATETKTTEAAAAMNAASTHAAPQAAARAPPPATRGTITTAVAPVATPAWSAAVTGASTTPTAAAATAGTSTTRGPTPQQQQQQQGTSQFAPKQPRPTLSAMIDRLRREVHGSNGSRDLNFSVKQSLKWLQGYDSATAALVDKSMQQYLHFIGNDQGLAVQACVVFLAAGQHEVFRGDTPSLRLTTADFPSRVLNKRLSYYRLLFSKSPSIKADMLAALIAYRPDIACHLTSKFVEHYFDQSTSAEQSSAAAAGLLLLPEGWEGVCEPRGFVSSFATAVMQNTNNAEKMLALIDKKLAAATAAAQGPGATDDTGAYPALATAAGGAQVQQQQLATSAAVGRSSGSSSNDLRNPTSSTSSNVAGASATVTATVSAATSGQQQQQQQVELQSSGPRGTGPNSSNAWTRGQRQPAAAALFSSSPSDSMHSRQQLSIAAPYAAAARRSSDSSSMTNSTKAEAPAAAAANPSSSSNKAEMVELALVQLQLDRPDVVRFASRDLRDRIKTLDLDAALAAVADLMDLPKGWDSGLGQNGKPQHKDYLSSVVSRAAAHAAAAAGSSTGSSDLDEWVTLDHSAQPQRSADNGTAAGDGSNSSGSGGSSGNGVIKQGMSLAAAWSQLERHKPWLVQRLQEKHRKEIRFEHGDPLTAQQQLQVLSVLDSVSRASIDKAGEPDASLMRIIRNAKLVTLNPAHPDLQAAFQEFAREQPQVAQYVDEGVYSRIVALAANDLPRALEAVRCLQETKYPSDFEKRYKNPSAYLMGILSNALKRSGH